jgi:hypothetical protein
MLDVELWLLVRALEMHDLVTQKGVFFHNPIELRTHDRLPDSFLNISELVRRFLLRMKAALSSSADRASF